MFLKLFKKGNRHLKRALIIFIAVQAIIAQLHRFPPCPPPQEKNISKARLEVPSDSIACKDLKIDGGSGRNGEKGENENMLQSNHVIKVDTIDLHFTHD